MMNIINRPFFLPFIAFSLILAVWEILARYSGWSIHVFPGPMQVFISLWELIANGTLLRHTVASLFRVTVGFYLAILLGIPLGILLGRLKLVRVFLNPVIQFLRPISPLAWIPLSMLWFGIGDKPAVFLIFLASFFPLVVSTTVAVQSINPVYFHVAANFNFTRYEVVTKIVIPGMLPSVITALRITITIAWLVVVAAEMIAVKSGLGYLILDSRNALTMDYVMDGMIVIGVIGLLLDHAMMRLSRIESVFWGTRSR
ncbi:ABC transporter permease [Desulfonema magnum]|uniref:ABC transporter, permease protein n=1 Tax=Desulfonema magnum TaxID=45655 RepID=A0A975BPT6_9BACT|nr:ABC transporter permease [Desulfonema magnum]QTA89222.1 putative ABC transporter, permease protein [Desulfonema magnum]